MKNLEYRTTSKRAKLLLQHEEGYEVDFKESASGLKPDDIVAFANSSSGGAILIGVKEIKSLDERQQGEIIGCPVGDKEKLSILNRAESCIPPVEIEIIVENSNYQPFFRVEIPSGKNKPYSTAGGTYKIRGNGRTNPLLPPRLLGIFIENEGREFVERFRKATQDLESSLSNLKAETLEEMQGLYLNVLRLEESLSHIFSSASSAEELADHAMMTSDQTLGDVQELGERIINIDENVLPHLVMRVNALLNKFGIEDPVLIRDRTVAKRVISNLYKNGHRNRKLIGQAKRLLPHISIEDITKWHTEIVQETKTTKTRRKKISQ